MIVRPFHDRDRQQCGALLAGRPAALDPHVTLVAEEHGEVVGCATADVDGGELRIALDGTAVGGSADVAAALYTPVAERAVSAGVWQHQVTVPVTADGRELDAWYELSFGREQAYAVRPAGAPRPPAHPSGVTVRRGGPPDLPALLGLIGVVGEHQLAAPVFSGIGPDFFAQLPAAHERELAAGEATYHLACAGEAVVGFAMTYPAETRTAPAGSIELPLVAVAPQHRCAGVGSALVAAVLDAEGDAQVSCDWRTTNRLAARFWRRWGFQPVAYRLRRTIAVRLGPRGG